MVNNIKELPIPIGNYTVGITQMEFKYTGYEEESREIPVLIYYPADSSEGKETYPYAFPEAFGDDSLANSFTKTKTHCYKDVCISQREKDYPVLIFNHGYGCFNMINTILCSDLASYGYIVVSVGHPGEATATRYSDGRIVKMDPKFVEPMTSGTLMEELSPLLTKIQSIDEKEDNILIELGRKFFAIQGCFNIRMDVWVQDTIKAADFIEKLNIGKIDTMFCGKMRLKHGIGLTGHSYGGSTAIQACHDDTRFVCGINIDGGNFGNYYGRDIGKPFLTIGNPHLWRLVRAIFVNNSNDAYHVTVKNADHMGFTDYLFLVTESRENMRLGNREPLNFRELVISYHIKFFEKYLLKSDVLFDDLGFEGTDFYAKSVESMDEICR